MSQTKSENEIEFRRISENFTFYVVEYASQIDGYFSSIILVDLVRDHKQYKDYLAYYQKQNFESKKRLVKIILQSYYTEYLEKYPNLFNDIDNIQKYRNDLAHHSKHYLSHSDGSYTFVLANPIIGKEIHITKLDMEDTLQKFEKTSGEVREIEEVVAKDRRYILGEIFRKIQEDNSKV